MLELSRRAINITQSIFDSDSQGYGLLERTINPVLLPIVKARIEAVYRMEPLRVANWETMDEDEYKAFVDKRISISAATINIGDPEVIKEAELNHDEKFETHNAILEDVGIELFNYEGYRALYPENTSLYYVLAQGQNHDLSRGSFNGGRLPLWFIDRISDEFSKYLYPGFVDRVHTFDWLLGLEVPQKDDTIASIFSALDTFCKPGVRVRNFYEPGDRYEQWITRNLSAGDQQVPGLQGELFEIPFAIYVSRDIRHTLEGMNMLERIINSDPNEFVQRSIDKFSI